MKALFSLAAIALCAAPVHAACTYPTAPAKIPDGSNATLAEMVAAQKAVKQFDEQINAYTACIKLEEDAQLKGDKLTAEQKKTIEAQQAQKNNARSMKIRPSRTASTSKYASSRPGRRRPKASRARRAGIERC